MKPVTVQSLREQGYKVQVHYQRYFDVYHAGYGYHGPDRAMTPYSPRKGFCFMSGIKGRGLVFTHPAHTVFPRGGQVEVTVTWPDGTMRGGVAVCSLQDNFDRKRGLRIALGRAMSIPAEPSNPSKGHASW